RAEDAYGRVSVEKQRRATDSRRRPCRGKLLAQLKGHPPKRRCSIDERRVKLGKREYSVGCGGCQGQPDMDSGLRQRRRDGNADTADACRSGENLRRSVPIRLICALLNNVDMA